MRGESLPLLETLMATVSLYFSRLGELWMEEVEAGLLLVGVGKGYGFGVLVERREERK